MELGATVKDRRKRGGGLPVDSPNPALGQNGEMAFLGCLLLGRVGGHVIRWDRLGCGSTRVLANAIL